MQTGIAPRFAMVAGEASGDMLAAHVLQGMRQRWPGLSAFGIGGPAMQAQGFAAWWPASRLAVRGYAEVLPHLRALLAMRRQTGDRLLADGSRPDLFIGIDAPDFNLSLETRLRQAGVPTIHFISPSFWAWRAKKLARLKAAADHVLCVFPFEPALLAEQGIAASYVGHPLASVITRETDPKAARVRARAQLGLAAGDTVLALLPGSREAEVRYLGMRFFEAAALVRRSMGAIKIIVPAIPALSSALLAQARASGMAEHVTILQGQSHAALAACNVALVASGTATLEAGCLGLPYALVYRVATLTYEVGIRLIRVKYLGMVNILGNRPVVREFIQHDATPAALADEGLRLLNSREARERLSSELASVTSILGGEPGNPASLRAARAVLECLAKPSSKAQ